MHCRFFPSGPSDGGAEAFHFLRKITKTVFVLCEEVPPVLAGKAPVTKATTWVWTPMIEGKNQPTPEHVRDVHPSAPQHTQSK